MDKGGHVKVTVWFEEGRAHGSNPEHFFSVMDEPSFENGMIVISCVVGGKQVDHWFKTNDAHRIEVKHR